MNRYDTIVIGSGFGGLSAAASLAAMGQRVLVVERQDGVGGFGHVFRRNGYVFDPAIHVTGQANPGQFLDLYLQLLGVRDRCEFIPIKEFYGAVFPGLRFTAPSGLDAFIQAHARHFPAEAEGIARFFQVCAQMTGESQQLSTRLSLRELDEAARQFPTLFRYRTALLAEVLDEFIADSQVKALCASLWPYLGVPPSRVSVSQFAAVLLALVEPNPSYVRGSFQQLADALAAAVRLHGGEILLGRHVTKIQVADGRVTGVVLDDGSPFEATAIVSNADARQTLEHLVGFEHLPPTFVRQFQRLKLSLSAFVLYTATTLDLRQFDLPHELFLYNHWDHDQSYRDVLAGRPGGTWLSFPTLVDDSLAPQGEHLVTCSTLAPYETDEPWPAARERYTETLLAMIEQVLPGYRAGLTFVESATPLTLERYTLNHRGAIYGWDHIPSQSVPKRLGHQPPIGGLVLAGHWTEPGSGSFRSIYSGFQAAQLLLGYRDPGQLIGALGQRASP